MDGNADEGIYNIFFINLGCLDTQLDTQNRDVEEHLILLHPLVSAMTNTFLMSYVLYYLLVIGKFYKF